MHQYWSAVISYCTLEFRHSFFSFTLCIVRVNYYNFDLFLFQSIVFCKLFKRRISVDLSKVCNCFYLLKEWFLLGKECILFTSKELLL